MWWQRKCKLVFTVWGLGFRVSANWGSLLGGPRVILFGSRLKSPYVWKLMRNAPSSTRWYDHE